MLPQVGRYQVLKQLGKGAMGVVYLADDPLLNRQVAIKTIDIAIDEESRRGFLYGRLLRDARAAASLSHPNIVGIYDVVVDNNCACIVMEYVAGEDLASYLSRIPVADLPFTVYVIRAMAAALDYTHSRGVIHRDIKPANVMLDAARTPKITDFGIARITEGATKTMTGTVMGTIEYMAPEQVKGEDLDGRADQFALGVVAYRMLTGDTLYGSQSITTMAYKIVNETPPPVRSRNASLPVGVDPVVAKALAKAPGDRYRNCSEFAEALAASLAGDREPATIATVAPPLPPPAQGRNLTAVTAIALAMAAGAAAGVVIWWKPWARPAQPAQAVVISKPAPESVPTPSAPAQSEPARKTAPAANPPAEKSPVKAPQKAAEAEPADDPASDASAPPPDTPAPAVEAFNHGRDLMQQNKFAEAIQAFTKASAIRPKWVQPHLSLGNAYQHLDQFDAAIREYSELLRLNPNLFAAYLQRGECYVHQQQDNPAFEDLNRAIAIKPEAPLALLARAGIYMRRQAYNKAAADFSETIRLQPDNANAYRGRAAARRELGDRPGARADQQKAEELSGRKGKKGG